MTAVRSNPVRPPTGNRVTLRVRRLGIEAVDGHVVLEQNSPGVSAAVRLARSRAVVAGLGVITSPSRTFARRLYVGSDRLCSTFLEDRFDAAVHRLTAVV